MHMLYTSPDKIPDTFSKPSVFIAGGISNCPDWQEELCNTVINTKEYDVVNPRRGKGFTMSNKGDAARIQITYEHDALSKVKSCIVWFPKETLCPITLFETGKLLVRAGNKEIKLLVGWHEDYQRAYDLEVQLSLETAAHDNLIVTGAGWDKFSNKVKELYS